MGRFTSDSGGGNFVQAPVGTHIARCFKIVDIGTQVGEWKGNKVSRSKIIVSWELPGEVVEGDDGDRVVTTSRFYTNSLSDKATLRHDLALWRGRDFTKVELEKFDLEAILGKPCLLTVVGGEDNKTKVGGVSGLPKGMECPPQVNPSFSFWLDEFSREKFDGLSDKVQAMIRESPEYDLAVNGPSPDDAHERGTDEDVPF